MIHNSIKGSSSCPHKLSNWLTKFVTGAMVDTIVVCSIVVDENHFTCTFDKVFQGAKLPKISNFPKQACRQLRLSSYNSDLRHVLTCYDCVQFLIILDQKTFSKTLQNTKVNIITIAATKQRINLAHAKLSLVVCHNDYDIFIISYCSIMWYSSVKATRITICVFRYQNMIGLCFRKLVRKL